VVKNFIKLGKDFAEKVIAQFKKSLEEIKKLLILKTSELEKAHKTLKKIEFPAIQVNDLEASDDDDLENRLSLPEI
jgi:hypothetical protein